MSFMLFGFRIEVINLNLVIISLFIARIRQPTIKYLLSEFGENITSEATKISCEHGVFA